MRNPFFLLLFPFVFAFISCQATGGAQGLKVDAFDKQLQANPGAQLVDVRTPEEFKTGHLKGAQNMDWNDNSFPAQAARLDKNKPVYVYCLSGVRSSKAAAKLIDMGFLQVYKLDGGIEAWNAAKKPVEK